MNNRVTLCPDGYYRWGFEVNLWKNSAVLRDLMMVATWSMGVVFVVMIAGIINNGQLSLDSFLWGLPVFGGIAAFFYLLFLVGYVVWAVQSGGRYAVLFEMDERGVTHKKMPPQVTVGNVATAIETMAASIDNPVLVIAASIDTWHTDYASVRRIKPVRRRNLIKVNELFTKNRVYVPDEDFLFVFNFISQHCPRAKK